MDFEDIRFEQHNGLAIITLNRPQRLNALLNRGLDELNRALDAVETNDELRVLVITGAPRPDGRPCFCAGLDLTEIAEKGVPPLSRPGLTGAIEGMSVLDPIENGFMRLCDRLESFPCPTIAAVDGVCTAGGLELALCCDFRIASGSAQFSDLHVKNLGLIGGGGATVRLTRLVGPARAKEMTFLGEVINGEEAYRIGLANKSVPPEKLMLEATEWGAKMVPLSSSALRLTKASINVSLDMDERNALRYSYICWAALGDAKEGAQEFLSDRTKKE